MIGVDSVLLREGAGGIGGFTKHVMGHSEGLLCVLGRTRFQVSGMGGGMGTWYS